MRFPVQVRAPVTPLLDRSHLLRCPHVQINGLDATNVGAHAAVNTRATNAQEASNVPRSPSSIITFTVSTRPVLRLLDKSAKRARVRVCLSARLRLTSRIRHGRAD